MMEMLPLILEMVSSMGKSGGKGGSSGGGGGGGMMSQLMGSMGSSGGGGGGGSGGGGGGLGGMLHSFMGNSNLGSTAVGTPGANHSMGMGLMNMLLSHNIDPQAPYNAAAGQLRPIQKDIHTYLDPVRNAYMAQYKDPTAETNKIGAQYQMSPGHLLAMHQALQGANQAAAAGGMAGTPAAQQMGAQLSSTMGNNDYNTYMNRELGQYNQGLSGAGQYGQEQIGDESSIAEMMASLAEQSTSATNQKKGMMDQGISSEVGHLF